MWVFYCMVHKLFPKVVLPSNFLQIIKIGIVCEKVCANGIYVRRFVPVADTLFNSFSVVDYEIVACILVQLYSMAKTVVDSVYTKTINCLWYRFLLSL